MEAFIVVEASSFISTEVGDMIGTTVVVGLG